MCCVLFKKSPLGTGCTKSEARIRSSVAASVATSHSCSSAISAFRSLSRVRCDEECRAGEHDKATSEHATTNIFNRIGDDTTCSLVMASRPGIFVSCSDSLFQGMPPLQPCRNRTSSLVLTFRCGLDINQALRHQIWLQRNLFRVDVIGQRHHPR